MKMRCFVNTDTALRLIWGLKKLNAKTAAMRPANVKIVILWGQTAKDSARKISGVRRATNGIFIWSVNRGLCWIFCSRTLCGGRER